MRDLLSHSASRFLLVGGLSYLFDLGLLVVLHGFVGISLPVATTLAFGVTLLLNFGLNRAFAFRSTSLAGPAFLRYLLLVGFNYLLTLLMVTGLAGLGVSYVVAKTGATAVISVLNYVAYRWWVFRA
ncbi:GtrA family protein [Micromonospora sp. NPDC093277]|uniref:GtrA family protein n=1 Tax=Micromonospora sp. NPDC093277 TaxID=3364291 RepID=UPI00382E0C84